MKFIMAIFIVALLFACNSTGKKKENRELAPKPEAATEDLSPALTSDTINNRWHFNKYLNDPATPQIAKDIFNNKWTPGNDSPLQFLNKLHGTGEEARPFYFKVVTNSYKKADGEYAEGLSHAGYEYVKHYPIEFANYFIGQDAFTDEDLKTWSSIVMGELKIAGEGRYNKPLATDYIAAIKENCKGGTAQQLAVIEKFGNNLNLEWAEFLKNIDK